MPLGWLHNSFIVPTCQLFTCAKELIEWETVFKISSCHGSTLSHTWQQNLLLQNTLHKNSQCMPQLGDKHSTAEGQCFFDCCILQQHLPWQTLNLWQHSPVNYILFGIMVVEYSQPTQWQHTWHWEVLNVCMCSYRQVAASCVKYYIYVHP